MSKNLIELTPNKSVIKIVLFTYGRKKDGTIGAFCVCEGKITDRSWLSIVSTAPIKRQNVNYHGRELTLYGQFTTWHDINGIVYLPSCSLISSTKYDEITRILDWCNKNKDVTKDLFNKYGLDFVAPKDFQDLNNSERYSDYALLVDELIQNSEPIYE